MGGLNDAGLQLDHVLLTWTDVGVFTGVFTQFSGIAFVNYAATDTQFNILHDGSATGGPFSMGSLTFNTQPTTGGGYYVKAEDPQNDGGLSVNLGIIFSDGTSTPDTVQADFDSHLDPVPPAQIFYTWS